MRRSRIAGSGRCLGAPVTLKVRPSKMLSRPRRGSAGSSNIDAAPRCPRAPRGVADAGSPLPTPLGGPGGQERFLPASHHPRSRLHLSGPRSKWSPSSAAGPCWVPGASTAHQPPESAQARRLSEQPPDPTMPSLGPWEGAVDPSSLHFPNLPSRGRDKRWWEGGGKAGRELASPPPAHTESILSSTPLPLKCTSTQSRSSWLHTPLPAKMHKPINTHSGAHAPRHNRHIRQIHSYWCTHSQTPSPRGAQPTTASALCHLVLERRESHPECPTQGKPDWREGPTRGQCPLCALGILGLVGLQCWRRHRGGRVRLG